MKTTLLVVLTIFGTILLFGQNNITFNFNHLLGDQPFALNTATTVDGDYELKIDRLEYYISEIEITHDGGIVTNVEDLYLLVRPDVQSVFDLGIHEINSIEHVRFGFGVDPGVNTADPALWPSDHPLSFQNPSMHWGWSTGYRFLAIEGIVGDDFLFNYEIHALGDNNYGMVNLAVDGLTAVDGNIAIGIDADYNQIFFGVDVSNGDIVHSATMQKAIKSLNNCKDLVFTPGDVASGLQELNLENAVLVSPNPITSDILAISLGNWNTGEIILTVFDPLGKMVQSEQINTSNVSMDVSNLKTGMYFVQLSDPNGNSVTKRFLK